MPSELISPSKAIEQGRIEVDGIPKKLVREAREKYSTLEGAGVHPWKILSDDVILEDEQVALEAKERRVAKQRYLIAQACAELMVAKRDGKITSTNDGMTWKYRFSVVHSLEDCQRFFALLNEEPLPLEKLRGNGYEPLLNVLVEQFGSRIVYAACIQEQLPFHGFASRGEAIRYLKGEVLRLRQSDNAEGSRVPVAELDKIVRSEYYNTNPVVRDVVDYFSEKGRYAYAGVRTPSRVLQSMGKRWKGKEEMVERFSDAETQCINPWKTLCNEVDPKNVEAVKILKVVAEKLLENQLESARNQPSDGMNWERRIEWCRSPSDFKKLFEIIGIPDEKWRHFSWLQRTSALPEKKGGIGKSMAAMQQAISERFESFPKFIAWMDETDEALPATQAVNGWGKPEDAEYFFRSLGVPEGKWRTSNYLEIVSKLPPEQGGIGRSLQGYSKAIRVRFGSSPMFEAWLDGKDKAEKTYAAIVAGWKAPKDARQYFKEIGVPDEMWRKVRWMVQVAKLSTEKGGIGKNLATLASEIYKRFGGHRKFVAWMDNKDEPEPTMTERVPAWKSPDEVLMYFRAIGVTDNKWRTASWLRFQAKLSKEKGGIGKSLYGLYDQILERWGTFNVFLACMEGLLPFNGIQNQQQARDLLRQEILRLRQSGGWIRKETGSSKISREEYDEIIRPNYYKSNAIVRAVVDYFQSKGKRERELIDYLLHR